MKQLYDMINRRKSIRKYDTCNPLTPAELEKIQQYFAQLQPLFPEIPVTFRLVKREETNCMWGEYCLLAYSEKQEGYLLNIGYLLEQMDLYFVSQGIGACWYGMGKADIAALDGKAFVIMMAFGRCKAESFRRSIDQARRKELSAICEGVEAPWLQEVLRVAHAAPSACNSQPWRVVYEEHLLKVFRFRGIRTPFTKSLVDYMNIIDMGIFLCFLELALEHRNISYHRTLLPESAGEQKIPVAVYAPEIR